MAGYDYQNLDVSLEDDVFMIRFDRPDYHNAIDEQTHEELPQAFRDAYDADARVVCITGKGKAFSAGGDAGWLTDAIEDPSMWRDTVKHAEELIESLTNIEKPVVAKVNGDAVGLGATIALNTDIVIASEDARIGDPHVKMGLVAGDGGVSIWPLLTNLHKAKEYLMTGDLMSAEEAQDLGLVNYSVPPEELEERVDEMIDKLASGPQVAVRYTKKSLNGWVDFANNMVFKNSLALEAVSAHAEDHEEAVEAFVEKRKADFPTGRDQK